MRRLSEMAWTVAGMAEVAVGLGLLAVLAGVAILAAVGLTARAASGVPRLRLTRVGRGRRPGFPSHGNTGALDLPPSSPRLLASVSHGTARPVKRGDSVVTVPRARSQPR